MSKSSGWTTPQNINPFINVPRATNFEESGEARKTEGEIGGAVTLREVARACGLSPATVSLALRNTGTIAETTCRRVQAEAARLGYRPNPLIASLASRHFRRNGGRSLTPVVALSNRSVHYRVNLEVEQPLRERADQLGYRLESTDFQDHPDSMRLGEQLFHRGVAGVILSNLYQLERLPEFPWQHFSVVAVVRQQFPLPFPVVRYEFFGAMVGLWDRLRARGYRRIGWAIMRHEPEHPDDRARLAATLYCIEKTTPKHRLPIFREPMVHGDQDRNSLPGVGQPKRPGRGGGISRRPLHSLGAGGVSRPGGHRVCDPPCRQPTR